MVQEAGLVSLIKTIAIIFAVYYSLKIIGRYFLPWLLKQFIKKQKEKYQQQNGFSNFEDSKRREGEVKITSTPSKQNTGDDLGEYVDYEEIMDDK